MTVELIQHCTAMSGIQWTHNHDNNCDFLPEQYFFFSLSFFLSTWTLSGISSQRSHHSAPPFTIFLWLYFTIFWKYFFDNTVQYLLTIFLLKTSHHSFVPAQCGNCKSNITISLKIVQNLFITKLRITVQNSDWRCKVWEYELSRIDWPVGWPS